MCRACGQFNVTHTAPVVRAVMNDGTEIVFGETTLVGRAKKHPRNTEYVLEEIWRTSAKLVLTDSTGKKISVCGNDIERILKGSLTTVSYDGELLSSTLR